MARVTFLGTSDAFHSAGRRNAAYLVDDGASRVAVDFGPTALQSLAILGIDPASIDAVLLTHLHGDHIVGVPFLVLDGIHHARRSRPLHVVGPLGTRARLEALFRATYDDALAGALPFELRVEEIEPNETRKVASLSVTSFEADHMDPPHRPLMLRVATADGRSVAFSGDTQWCEALVRCARGADLLVAECTGLAPPIGRHCTLEDWRARGAAIEARRIVLSHLGAGARAELLRSGAFQAPPLEVADDGLVVEV